YLLILHYPPPLGKPLIEPSSQPAFVFRKRSPKGPSPFTVLDCFDNFEQGPLPTLLRPDLSVECFTNSPCSCLGALCDKVQARDIHRSAREEGEKPFFQLDSLLNHSSSISICQIFPFLSCHVSTTLFEGKGHLEPFFPFLVLYSRHHSHSRKGQ